MQVNVDHDMIMSIPFKDDEEEFAKIIHFQDFLDEERVFKVRFI